MELKEEEFKGKVTVSNWAMSRGQRIVRDISFESGYHDIYNPKYSSEDGGDDPAWDEFADEEEAKGRVCDERLSELNPCDDEHDRAGL